MPKVSVCIPVSRVESVLPVLKSIQRQTWKDWELVAVGQGSFDNPRVQRVCEIVHHAQAQDSRIRYVHIEKSGATRAKNAAILASTGPIIAEIDDDAEAAPDWLSILVSYLEENPAVDVVGGSVIKPAKAKRGFAVCPHLVPEERIYDPGSMAQPPQGWNWISCNVGMRADVFEKVGLYDEYLGPGSTFPVADDTDLLLRFEAAKIAMGSTPRLVVHHTYGYRYGLQAFTRHQYNYAFGNGGLAAKQTLSGDRRGEQWYQTTRRERLLGWIKPFRPHNYFRGLYGWKVFRSAYDRCLKEFRVENNLLVPRAGA